MHEIAPDVAVVPMALVNAYFIGSAESWVLVDTGTPFYDGKIARAAAQRFGSGSRPQAIVLTHGHFDHAGSARPLAERWDVPVYAHRLERPYLTGKSSYPPLDPTSPGFFSVLSRVFPSSTENMGDRLLDLDTADPLPGVEGWECHLTPGHTAGHVSFFRPSDRVLIAGDAVTTMDLETASGLVTKAETVRRPPVPATTDWNLACASIRRLAKLRPRVIAAGHGRPVADAADQLQRLAETVTAPDHGRYCRQPAKVDATGIVDLPPKPPDPAGVIAAGIAAGLLIAVTAAVIARLREPPDKLG